MDDEKRKQGVERAAEARKVLKKEPTVVDWDKQIASLKTILSKPVRRRISVKG